MAVNPFIGIDGFINPWEGSMNIDIDDPNMEQYEIDVVDATIVRGKEAIQLLVDHANITIMDKDKEGNGPVNNVSTPANKLLTADELYDRMINGELHFNHSSVGKAGYFTGFAGIPSDVHNGVVGKDAVTSDMRYPIYTSDPGSSYQKKHFRWDDNHTTITNVIYKGGCFFYQVTLMAYAPEDASEAGDGFIGHVAVGEETLWIPTGNINNVMDQELLLYVTSDPSDIDATSTQNGHEIDINGSVGGAGGNNNNGDQPEGEPEARDDYAIDFSSSNYSEEASWYDELYWMNNNGNLYSLKSFESIVGMPIQFMANVDARFGQSTFGKQYSEDILYDAPICIIDPGAPNLADSSLAEGVGEGFDNLIKKIATYYTWGQSIAAGNGKEVLELWLKEWLVGEDGGSSFARFYGFESQYLRYIQYVNTLCHLFATYLGIADEIIPGTDKKFKEYDDYIDEVETTDSGLGLKLKYGNYPGLLIYYQPDSSLSQTFNNQTQESSLASKLNELSNYSKEMAFLAGGLGFPGKGVTVGDGISTSTMFSLSDLSFSFGSNNILKRIFNRAGEGVGTIIGGNNLTLPEIYSNSNMTGSEYVLNIKLVNPYGSPEAAFLFQMRHLARLLAVSLPRQYGPNGYTAPFIIRAFSKGQFNIQLGIVESLSIRRAGNGGENQTIHGIPMELEITMVLKDMYQQIAIANEYTNAYGLPSLSQLSNIKQLKLIFNNIGLIDFIASYAGYNLNQPSIDVQMDFILNSMWNNLSDVVKFNGTINVFKWEFPRYSRSLRDNCMNAIWVTNTWIA